ncbi:MAG: hypothetical protein AAF541_07605 [Pseudomonadota bacterium]
MRTAAHQMRERYAMHVAQKINFLNVQDFDVNRTWCTVYAGDFRQNPGVKA